MYVSGLRLLANYSSLMYAVGPLCLIALYIFEKVGKRTSHRGSGTAGTVWGSMASLGPLVATSHSSSCFLLAVEQKKLKMRLTQLVVAL